MKPEGNYIYWFYSGLLAGSVITLGVCVLRVLKEVKYWSWLRYAITYSRIKSGEEYPVLTKKEYYAKLKKLKEERNGQSK
jgi:hypothetical protein